MYLRCLPGEWVSFSVLGAVEELSQAKAVRVYATTKYVCSLGDVDRVWKQSFCKAIERSNEHRARVGDRRAGSQSTLGLELDIYWLL